MTKPYRFEDVIGLVESGHCMPDLVNRLNELHDLLSQAYAIWAVGVEHPSEWVSRTKKVLGLKDE
jgi:hypothetical protein